MGLRTRLRQLIRPAPSAPLPILPESPPQRRIPAAVYQTEGYAVILDLRQTPRQEWATRASQWQNQRVLVVAESPLMAAAAAERLCALGVWACYLARNSL